MLHRLYRATLAVFFLGVFVLISTNAQHKEKRDGSTIQESLKDDSDIALPTGEFTVQVGAFLNKPKAERLGTRFRKDGWSVDVYKNVLDRKKTYYLVWIGTYASVDDAHQQQKLIEQKYGIHGVIRQRIGWEK